MRKFLIFGFLLFSVLGFSQIIPGTSTFLGAGAGDGNAHNNNVGIGNNSLRGNSGGYNTAIGAQAMLNNSGSTGTGNVAVGERCLISNTSGNNNVSIGKRTLENNTTGEFNTAVGYYAMPNVASGIGNVALGYWAAQNLISGSANIFIGHYAGPTAAATISNKLFIHNSASENPLIYGDFSSGFVNINGSLGVGMVSNAVPGAKMQITGPSNSSGLRFTNLLATTTTGVTNNTNNKFLSLNANGDVILQNLPSSATGVAAITAGTNVAVAGNGSSATPYVISSKNIYTDNDALTSNRTMAMGNFNLNFTSPSTTAGKIYIGATPIFPTDKGDYKLYVEGGILTEKVKVALRSGADWRDGVFAIDYPLMPLQDVETFIKENKHLPGIESADELVKNGLDLGDMQAKQMGKIEELTLYVIEQNKTLEKQKNEIEELKSLVKILMDRK